MLLDRDGFHVDKTPTLDRHLEFLNNLSVVKGLSLNSNLYSKAEDEDDNVQEEIENDEKYCVQQESNSTDED